MFSRIRCIHIAVKSVNDAVKEYSDNYGMKPTRSGELPELGVRNALLPIGDAFIEFIEPIDKERGPLAQFLKARGECVYMTAWEVENVNEAVRTLQGRGVHLINADPQARAKGANVFIHPKSARGVMIELLEKPK
ncbi:MAG: VOC family protein [Deltaproteobacteria bacterium]|nr:VOC family protein [Deltaproteobacteria bacterium]